MFSPRADRALIDAWTFARQMDQFWSGGAGADAFGTFQPEAVEVSRRLVDQVRTIGNSIAVSPEAAADFERRVIDSWLTAHPLRDTSFARESPMARFADQSRASGDTLQSVGTMEDLAIGVTQQARIYLADLPRQIRGELDLMRYDILTAEDVSALQGDLHVSAAAANRIASTAETISPLVLNERRIVLDELNRQRALVMERRLPGTRTGDRRDRPRVCRGARRTDTQHRSGAAGHARVGDRRAP